MTAICFKLFGDTLENRRFMLEWTVELSPQLHFITNMISAFPCWVRTRSQNPTFIFPLQVIFKVLNRRHLTKSFKLRSGALSV